MSVKIFPEEAPVKDTYIYLREYNGGVEVMAQRGTLDQTILRLYETGIVLVDHSDVGIKRVGRKVAFANI